MDTKTLVVGQDVYMVSGVYCNKGKVVKVTPEGVEVQTFFAGPTSYKEKALLKEHSRFPWVRYFDVNGKERNPPEFPRALIGTIEGGPWELVNKL
ncbi:MAG TPA: hypothetical protein VEF05_07560 [Terriglobales bacterium]|nr:hypothetical protein [Terriglobales bacterium]